MASSPPAFRSFFRTPKNADNHGFWVAISEGTIMLLLWGAALGIYLVQGSSRARHAFLGGDAAGATAAVRGGIDHGQSLSSLPKPAPKVEPVTVA